MNRLRVSHGIGRILHQGTALLPALIVIMMLTVIVVMLFSLSTMQLRSSASGVAGHDVAALQDMAVNTAIGQMRMGSIENNALWVSQPGAIRTYHANSGRASRIYKLYSANDMVVEAGGIDNPSELNLEQDVPPDWRARHAAFVDLNEPALDDGKELVFPIVDPRAMDAAVPQYPGSQTPEGFRYGMKLAVSGQLVSGVHLASGASSAQRLPMPVRWIYVLQDGSLGVMDDSNPPRFQPFAGQGTATEANPIVGRYAFWSDDETSKVNINTASEGIFWDTPRCATEREIAFATEPPARNEVQRFGGHPATTCLSTVLYPGERLVPGTPGSDQKLENIYAIAPRVNADGGILRANRDPVTFDTDRLYASVDELLLDDPSDVAHEAQPFRKRAIQKMFAADPSRLKRLRFFLTAESRAPEITAAGTPRVSIWPVSYRPEPEANQRTPFDNVSAFASTLGGHPYHFRRSSATSNIDEFSNFYNNETTDPLGFGMVHNNYLAQYLIELARNGGQGFPRSLAEKYDGRYGSWRERAFNSGSAMVSILEYIRQCNLNDTTHSTQNVAPRVPVDAYGQSGENWIGTDTLGQVSAVDIIHYGEVLNDVDRVLVREQDDEGTDRVWTTGIGREYTVSEFGLVFILAAENPSNPAVEKVNPDLVAKLNLQPGQKAIQVGVVAEGFCPAQGYSMIAPSSSFTVDYLQDLRIATESFGPPREMGGAVIVPGNPPVQAVGGDEPFAGWGHLLHSVSHLQYLCAVKPEETPFPGRMTNGAWWVGWGGSGGYWMYSDSDASANEYLQLLKVGDFDTADSSLESPSLYGRGYFIVPSGATSMAISSNRTGPALAARCLEIAVGNQRNGDYSSRRLMVEVPPNLVVPVPQKPAELGFTFSKRYKEARTKGGGRFAQPELIDINDVVRTWVVRHGDYRLTYQRLREGGYADGLDEKKRLMVPHPAWDPESLDAGALARSRLVPQIHAFVKAGGGPHSPGGTSGAGPTFGNGSKDANLVENVSYLAAVRPDFPVEPNSQRFRANVPADYPYSVRPSDTRDWDNGTGIAPDGAYWNKPDDGARIYDGNTPPYFSSRPWDGVNLNQRPINQTTAPNQLVPSAVMFGSLPSAPSTGLQWTTFLFRPDITPGGHLGSADHGTQGHLPGAPPDHALLDWFWMPVVQPYPISEPFSTAGKINMNYRIVPFTHITRATGLHAVLKSEEILAIPTSAGQTYKDYTRASSNRNWRHYIDADKTLLQWEDAFNRGRFFKHASEICEKFLVPQDEGISATNADGLTAEMGWYWDTHRLSGDNTLERPYANIYPRLTTKSNTFRVHFIAQVIKKARSSDPRTFVVGQDSIAAERQGDALVERAIDPNDLALKTPDFDYIAKARNGTLSTAKSLDSLHTWRVRSIRRFSR